MEKCIFMKDIKITFWDTVQYFHTKKLRKSFLKILSLKFVQAGYKRQKVFFFFNIVTWSFMPASPNLLVQLSYF